MKVRRFWIWNRTACNRIDRGQGKNREKGNTDCEYVAIYYEYCMEAFIQ
jgi:hypothetical protein